MHGGTGWKNRISIDLSASVNSYPLPGSITRAAINASNEMALYPDIEYLDLRRAIGSLEAVDADRVLCGNGASELFVAIARALKPKTVGLISPCYTGYEYVLEGKSVDIKRIRLDETRDFSFGEEELEQTQDMDLLFLATPNNPTGRVADRDMLLATLKHCEKEDIWIVLDKCFLRNTQYALDREYLDVINCFNASPKAIVVDSFTKVFALAGARIGYLVSGNKEIVQKIGQELSEWNLSIFAEKIGIECARVLMETDYITNALKYNEKEKNRIAESLESIGARVYPGDANFILTRIDGGIRNSLLEDWDILLRNCSDFDGLDDSYTRIGIGSSRENDKLIQGLKSL